MWLAEFEVSPAILGIAVGIGYALIGLAAPLAGGLSDRFGSRPIVLLSIGGMGIAFALLSLVNSVTTLTIVLVVWGAAAALYHPAGLSLISRRVEQRGKVLAYHGAGGNLGTVVFPFAVIGLLLVFDWRATAVVIAIPAGLCVLAGFLLRFEPMPEQRLEEDASGERYDSAYSAILRFLTTSRGLFVGGFVVVFVIQVTYGMYYRGVLTFLPDVLADLPVFEPFAVGRHEIEAGQLAYTGILLVGVFGQYAGGVLSDRASPERALVGTFVALTLASFLFVPAATVGVAPLLGICAVLGFCIYAFAPIGQSLVAEYASERRHGLSFGYVYFGTFGVGALGAAVAGMTLDFGGVDALFAALTALVAVCTAISLVLLFEAEAQTAP